MKIRYKFLFVTTTLLGLGVGACGGDSSHGPKPMASQTFSTSDLLAMAKVSSESDEPFIVNDGAVAISGTDDSADAMTIN